jgi:hypothetical protein
MSIKAQTSSGTVDVDGNEYIWKAELIEINIRILDETYKKIRTKYWTKIFGLSY